MFQKIIIIIESIILGMIHFTLMISYIFQKNIIMQNFHPLTYVYNK